MTFRKRHSQIMGDQAYQILQKELFATVVKMSIMVGVSYFTISWFLKKLDINGNRGEAAKKKVRIKMCESPVYFRPCNNRNLNYLIFRQLFS